MEAWRLEERILTCGPLLGKGLTSTSGWEDWRNHSYEIGIIKHRVHSIHTNNVIISSQKSPPYSKSASHQALTNSGEGWSIRRQTLGNFTKKINSFVQNFPSIQLKKNMLTWYAPRSGMVGMLQREEVDIQLGALTILAAREQVDNITNMMIMIRI